MNSEGFWSELPIDVKVEIFVRIHPADKLISLDDHKRLVSLKIICKDWNFVLSRFCLPKLCPPNPCAGAEGFINFVESYESDYVKGLNKDMSFLMSRLNKDFKDGCTFQFRSNTKSRSRSDEDRIKQRIWSLVQSMGLEIRDCCNGMILFASSVSQYLVGNPVTGQQIYVPVNPKIRSTIRSSLVFDPSSVLFGENQDPFFKIFNFRIDAISNLMEVEIYSSDKGEWRTNVVHISEPHYLYGRSVYFSRALYSLSAAMYLVCIENIIAETETDTSEPGLRAWSIALPDKDEKPSYIGCIGDCSGRFCYSNINVQSSSISVWMLGKYEWMLMHIISIREEIGHIYDQCEGFDYEDEFEHLERFYDFRPSVLLPNHDNEMIIYVGLQHSLLAYNVKMKITDLLPHSLPPGKKLNQDGNMFFPFSPCPLTLKLSS